jgi:hypothetical protein
MGAATVYFVPGFLMAFLCVLCVVRCQIDSRLSHKYMIGWIVLTISMCFVSFGMAAYIRQVLAGGVIATGIATTSALSIATVIVPFVPFLLFPMAGQRVVACGIAGKPQFSRTIKLTTRQIYLWYGLHWAFLLLMVAGIGYVWTSA